MIKIIDAQRRNGYEWCTCCAKNKDTKRISFSNDDGSNSISIVLCDDCRKELICKIKGDKKE